MFEFRQSIFRAGRASCGSSPEISVVSRLARIAALALFVVAGRAGAAEVDQIAQSTLIGISGKTLRACLGPPAQRRAVGFESIWTYPVGTVTADGPFLAFPLDLNLLGSGGVCEVRFVLDRYGVSEVDYALPSGTPLPLGKLCNFPVEACAAR